MQLCPDTSTPYELGSAEAIESRLDALRDQIAALEGGLARAERLATLGAMSGAVAHEFNNILTPLVNYASLALANLDDEHLVRKALQKTVENAERAAHLSESLLGSLRTPLADSQGCELRTAVERALGALVRAPAADGIEVLIDVPDHLQAAINSSDLHQVLLNLVLNACDAMRPGPGTLAFSARVENDRVRGGRKSCIPDIYQSSDRNDSVVLRVVDTGSGIDPELVERIFDPLVTTKVWGESRKQQGGGSGLGLTICKRLVERAGGRITLRSEPGIGSCFSIVLPRAVESHSDPRSAPLAA